MRICDASRVLNQLNAAAQQTRIVCLWELNHRIPIPTVGDEFFRPAARDFVLSEDDKSNFFPFAARDNICLPVSLMATRMIEAHEWGKV